MILTLLFSFSFATELARQDKRQIPNPPTCINQETEIESIRNGQQANRKTSHKYKSYKDLFTKLGIGTEEAYARLVYAEAKATKCSAPMNDIIQTIAEVIHQRIIRRSENIDSVIFERDQFASSLNLYSESEYREFLCPTDLENWEKAKSITTNLLSRDTSNTLPQHSYHYYFFKHSSKFTPPTWTKSYTVSKDIGKGCVTAYQNPNWK